MIEAVLSSNMKLMLGNELMCPEYRLGSLECQSFCNFLINTSDIPRRREQIQSDEKTEAGMKTVDDKITTSTPRSH
jgi:hypothetical protein